MRLFDVAFFLDKQQIITKLLWHDKQVGKQYASFWGGAPGKNIHDFFQLGSGQSGILSLPPRQFCYHRIALGAQEELLLLRENDEYQSTFQYALELLPYGIQIYDATGHLSYINETSLKISSLPKRELLLGKYLLDIWNVGEEISTVLSCLRKQSAIHQRIDTFLDANKGNITTVNSAYPLLSGSEFKGAILFEQDLNLVQRQKEYLKGLEPSLKLHSMQTPARSMSGYTFDCISGNSVAITSAVTLAQRFAEQECNIMLIGETGTGKEIFAQSIHRASRRKWKKLVAINCAAIPEPLIESMLFGTRKGAFTGSENKPGLFEEADGGTLFLDEINSMSLSMQSKILRAVQDGVFRRVGSNTDFQTDVRIISSCNEDPFDLVEKKSMRKDLFYRLSTVQIRIPPLRERIEDIPTLVSYYFDTRKTQFAKQIDYIAPQVMELFAQYEWPGNIRELFHVLDYAINVVDAGVINISDLPEYIVSRSAPKPSTPLPNCQPSQQDVTNATLDELVGEFESTVIVQVLEHYGYNISKAAQSLGICRQSLSYRIKKYGIRF
ncbi:MAG: sigma-54 interaction domain-containing protein [Candidatus Fimivivens sp.]